MFPNPILDGWQLLRFDTLFLGQNFLELTIATNHKVFGHQPQLCNECFGSRLFGSRQQKFKIHSNIKLVSKNYIIPLKVKRPSAPGLDFQQVAYLTASFLPSVLRCVTHANFRRVYIITWVNTEKLYFIFQEAGQKASLKILCATFCISVFECFSIFVSLHNLIVRECNHYVLYETSYCHLSICKHIFL